VLKIGDRLTSLLTIQQSLSKATTTTSLIEILPDIFKTTLEITGGQKGRILLLNREFDQAVIISANDGLIETEILNTIPNYLIDEMENFPPSHGQDVFIANSQNEVNTPDGSGLEGGVTPWFELLLPLQIEDVTMGLISASTPGSDRFTEEDILQLSLVVNLIAGALTAVKYKANWQSAEERLQEKIHDNNDLAAILVHDLQGPLGNILTSLELLQGEIAGDGASPPPLMMDIAIRSSKVLEALVNSLLDISRLEAGQEIIDLEPIAISDIIDYVAEVEQPVFEQRQVTLVRALEPDLPLINANANILQRIILNLFDNAIKVSKRGHEITIRAFVNADEDSLRICVLDQGPGIPEAYHERIFEKYQRVDTTSASKGLGLGLAFCKLATEAHGGRIWVENTSDQGACFCIILPVGNPIARDA
jgi:signal transduction histidine kinase